MKLANIVLESNTNMRGELSRKYKNDRHSQFSMLNPTDGMLNSCK